MVSFVFILFFRENRYNLSRIKWLQSQVLGSRSASIFGSDKIIATPSLRRQERCDYDSSVHFWRWPSKIMTMNLHRDRLH